MDARTLRSTAEGWLHEARPGVLVEVTQAQGSVPRDAGTRMLVGPDEVVGTIGGGHLELQAISQSREMLDTAHAAPLTRHVPLGPALGQCCGGAVTLRFERLQPSHLAHWPEPPPRFHLQLYGAGHVGRAVAGLLATLDVRVDWIDERESEFPARLGGGAWPHHVRRVAVDAVEGEVVHAPAGACYLVMTHRHDLDERICEAVLRRGDFAYLGLIGSKTKRQRFVNRFVQRGLPAAAIERMTCPIGVPGIEGKEPAVIAVAVAAQLLATR